MPEFRYVYQGVEVVRDAAGYAEAIRRAGQVIRNHQPEVRSVDVNGRHTVGLAEDLIHPDEVICVPAPGKWDHQSRLPGPDVPPPTSVQPVGHTVAALRQRLGGLDDRAEVCLAIRYPTPRQVSFDPDPFVEAANGRVYVCEGRVLGELPQQVTGLLGW